MERRLQTWRVRDLRPYEHNARKNAKAAKKVAESIQQCGYCSPIIIDERGQILAGHTRHKAIKLLGWETCEVMVCTGMSQEQKRKFRILDNRTNEVAQWDLAELSFEVEDLDFGDLSDLVGSLIDDRTPEQMHRAAWKTTGKKLNMKQKLTVHSKYGFFYTAFYQTGNTGRDLQQVKQDREMVHLFADNLVDYVQKVIGQTVGATWCIATTPRRRHKQFHFATQICKEAADALGITFYEDVASCATRDRINPEFVLNDNPLQENVILYDDIVTTGKTLSATRQLLTQAGHHVLVVVSVQN